MIEYSFDETLQISKWNVYSREILSYLNIVLLTANTLHFTSVGDECKSYHTVSCSVRSCLHRAVLLCRQASALSCLPRCRYKELVLLGRMSWDVLMVGPDDLSDLFQPIFFQWFCDFIIHMNILTGNVKLIHIFHIVTDCLLLNIYAQLWKNIFLMCTWDCHPYYRLEYPCWVQNAETDRMLL